MTDQAKFLSDILQAIDLIEDFTQDCSSFFDYQNDLKTKSSVERQLEIIGEAVNNLKRLSQEPLLSHTTKIVAVRNRLVHAYDAIDDTIIWAILKRHLPNLKLEAEEALRNIM